MSTRMLNRFLKERAGDRKLFVPFITAGDGGLGFTERAVLALERAGADAVELGVPFSDPLADGKVIQRASERALRSGTRLPGVLETVRRIRRRSQVPILLMGYLNPFLHPSLEHTALAASRAGVDGFIIPDLPPEAAEEYRWRDLCRRRRLDTVFLVTPNSPSDRIRRACEASTGYVYYVSVTGITGVRRGLPADLAAGVSRAKIYTPLPVLVGFGVSEPSQAAAVARVADGVIVGSALIRALEQGRGADDALRRMTRLARALSKAVKNT